MANVGQLILLVGVTSNNPKTEHQDRVLILKNVGAADQLGHFLGGRGTLLLTMHQVLELIEWRTPLNIAKRVGTWEQSRVLEIQKPHQHRETTPQTTITKDTEKGQLTPWLGEQGKLLVWIFLDLVPIIEKVVWLKKMQAPALTI